MLVTTRVALHLNFVDPDGDPMNCWKTKYGYGGTSVDLCHTYYMRALASDSPLADVYTYAACYRSGDNCLRDAANLFYCTGPPG